MLAGQSPSRVDLPVCAECGRIATRHAQPEIRRLADQAPEPDECLLSQGFVCLGSISRSGCGAVCTGAGSPCWGCRGPIDRVLVEPTHGILFDLTRRISHFTGKSREQVQQQLPDMLHALYSFTLSAPEMRRKGAEAIHDYIRRIQV
jgi:F420-non-reducing hydrogenase small subunit